MQWDEKELDTQFTPNVYIWTPNSEILAKALVSISTSFLYDERVDHTCHHTFRMTDNVCTPCLLDI